MQKVRNSISINNPDVGKAGDSGDSIQMRWTIRTKMILILLVTGLLPLAIITFYSGQYRGRTSQHQQEPAHFAKRGKEAPDRKLL